MGAPATSPSGLDVSEGTYSVVLGGPAESLTEPLFIAQTGLMPAGTGRIRFLLSGQPVTLRVGGGPIRLTPLEAAPMGTVMGGDISAFSGTEAELRFESEFEDSMIDSIRFVPEPGALGLALVSFAVAAGARRQLTPQRC